MNVIQTHFQFLNVDAIRFADFEQQLAHPLAYFTRQNLLAILGCPHQMVLRVIDVVRTAAKGHTSSLAALHSDALAPQRLRRCALSSPPQAAGYPERF